MYKNTEALQKIYSGKTDFVFLGLTGRTGSGCTTVANILRKDKFQDLDLRDSKEYDYQNAEERKYKIICDFMKENENWKPFYIIEISSLIFASALEKGIEAFGEFVESITNENRNPRITVGDKNKVMTVISNNKHMFEDAQTYSLNNINDDSYRLDFLSNLINFYTKVINEYKSSLKLILEQYSCFEIKRNKMTGIQQRQYHLFTYLMQEMGNNIRCSGDPFNSNFNANCLNLFSSKIEKLVKIIKYVNEERGLDTRICIDAIRNPYEAVYFKDRYKSFHLMAVTTKERDRKMRLSYLKREELNNLDDVEYGEKMKSPEDSFFHQNIRGCLEIADIHIYNPDVDGERPKFFELTEQIIKYIALMLHPGLITPTHIERCMQLAFNAKYNSGCLSRQVGAIVTRNDYSIQSVGWNDVPKGQISCNLRDVHGFCRNRESGPYSQFEINDERFNSVLEKIADETKGNAGGRCISYCFKDIYNGIQGEKNQVYTRALHAEENAFLQISKYGGTQVKDGILFSTASPCELCSKKAYQLGIKTIYYIDPYPGISQTHILAGGKGKYPEMKLFYGAIGQAYLDFYEPRIPLKDELELITNVNMKKIAKGEYAKEPVLKYEDLTYKEVTIDLEFLGRSKIISRRQVHAVIKKSVSKISRCIYWTGSSDINISIDKEKSDADITLEQRKNGDAYEYDICFEKKELKDGKSRELKYCIVIEARDEQNVMEPYFAHMVKYKTEKLNIRLVVPKNGTEKIVDQVKQTVYADIKMDLCVQKDTNINQNINLEDGFECDKEKTVYNYSIDNANVNYTYALEWVFTS